jgi:thioredoxin reductase
MALMGRAYSQAQKFGAEMAIPDEAGSLRGQAPSDGGRFLVALADQERVRARAVVVACGARYRRLDLENLASFEVCGALVSRSLPCRLRRPNKKPQRAIVGWGLCCAPIRALLTMN